MNYAEEQLQNAICNELEAIKSRNKELISENEELTKEINDLRNEREYLYNELSKQSKSRIAESEDSKEERYNKAMSDNENLKLIIKNLAKLL